MQTCIELDKTKDNNKKEENDGIQMIEEFKKTLSKCTPKNKK